ncbi:hypothetical protein GJ698_04895 [Pseudoduganella sp. FT26W]|uniref:Uncharacterized protein n=1 Tax=Duganella aquatilis TaxID=2666082 RepID=A0A844D5P1_9BURK|nr:hypothetical protein [Duganella aquatilis]MRW83426.1 hypothetical protein [Duganella aquatilis]
MKNLIALLAGALLLISAPAFADRSAYRGVVDLKVESEAFVAVHHHDWKNPLHPSSLHVRERLSGKELFDKAVPALTYLWISPDSQYIVGLSNIKYLNQYQLIVMSRSGEELLKQDMTTLDWARVHASVSNWINWYKEPAPKITLIGITRTLEIEDANGVTRSFYF